MAAYSNYISFSPVGRSISMQILGGLRKGIPIESSRRLCRAKIAIQQLTLLLCNSIIYKALFITHDKNRSIWDTGLLSEISQWGSVRKLFL